MSLISNPDFFRHSITRSVSSSFSPNFRMPDLRSVRTPVPNLFLTGQSLMLHGVYGVTMTALFTCAEVLGREQIWNILMNRKGVEI